MTIPYAMLKVLKGEKPPYLKESIRDPKSESEFLMKDKNMKGYYLGDCLDSCRWGSDLTVMYEMTSKEMITFVKIWMRQNKGNFQNLWHERKIDELYKKFELPYINRACTGTDHKEIIMDIEGKLRCAHKEIMTLKPSFTHIFEGFDESSQTKRITYHVLNPVDPNKIRGDVDIDGDEFKHHVEEFKKWEEEEPTLVVTDYCYTILSDRGTILSLETILDRLNLEPIVRVFCNMTDQGCSPKRLMQMPKRERESYLGTCFGHIEKNNHLIFPFDDWNLAFYVQRWCEQLPNGKSPLFDKDVK